MLVRAMHYSRGEFREMSQLPPGRFFGRNVRAWSVGDLLLSESTYAPATRLPTHSHAHAYLALAVRGGYRESCGHKERQCLPSTVIYHPPGEAHSNQFQDSVGRVFRVEFGTMWLVRLSEHARVLAGPAEFHGGAPSLIASRLFAEFRARDSVSPLMIEALALEFASGVFRADEGSVALKQPRWLEDVREYLHAHFCEEIELQKLARTAGVHAAHLNRAFRTRHFCSVGEYVRRLRVDYAARELAGSPRPIADIASAAGFADQSHFSRVFVRITGLSPGRYRRLHIR
jgi:AraC family transcriptional regulator